MSKTAKKSANAEKEEESPLAFEEALSQLEAIVQGMESDQLPLDELIKNYETGTKLYQVCESRLDEAQGRIEVIRKKRDGSVKLESLETTEATNE